MTHRYVPATSAPPLRALPFTGLRSAFADGYGARDLRADILAGLVVGVVALPLSMALAIAVGVPPQHGLYTAIIAGLVVPLLGGSRFQVTGPTAAFVVILAPVVSRFGIGGLLLAGAMGGAILVAMGLFRLGRLIQFIPHPVTTGFTAGIGTVIGVLQLKDLLGLTPTRSPDHFAERVHALWQARGTASLSELGIGLGTLLLLVLLPRVSRRIPAPLVALPAAAVAAFWLHRHGLDVATIGSRFHSVIDGVRVDGIPRLPPLPIKPWALGPELPLELHTLRVLLPSALAIAVPTLAGRASASFPATQGRILAISEDFFVPAPELLARAAAEIEQARSAGRVLVCCALGYSRSAAAVATWLVSARRAASVDAAIAEIRRARPRIALDAGARAAIVEAARHYPRACLIPRLSS